jgi:hypothetical protein
MTKFVLALFLGLGAATAASAQADMSCADLMKANAQLDAATKEAAAKDPTAAAMDKKIADYCAKNPKAKASEAMEKALAD